MAQLSIADELLSLNSGPGWKPDVVNNLISNTAEGPLYDRKRWLPLIRCRQEDVVRLDSGTAETIRDFVVDVISMLNSARRRGKPAYIVFGVDDDWKPNENGILESTTWTRDVSDIQQFLLSRSQLEYLQRTLIEKEDINGHADRLIRANPLDYIRYEFGWIECQGRRYFLSYLEFVSDVPTAKPFCVNPQISKGDRIWLDRLKLRSGSVYSRIGDRNREFLGDEIAQLVSWRDIPFLSVDTLKAFFDRHRKYLVRVSPHQDTHLSEVGKQDLRATLEAEGSEHNATSILQHFLSLSDQNVLFLLGKGGAGKTTTLRDLALELIESSMGHLQSQHQDDPPTCLIPIYIHLAGFDPAQDSIRQVIGRKLLAAGGFDSSGIDRVLEDRALGFAVFVDGIDEVPQSSLWQAKTDLFRTIGSYPHAKFVVASRPMVLADSERQIGLTADLIAMSSTQITARIRAEGLSSITETELLGLIDSDRELMSLLARPRMLSAMLTGIVGEGRLSFGGVLRQTLDGFLREESEKLQSPSEYQRMRSELRSLALKWWKTGTVSAEEVLNFTCYDRFIQCGLLQLDGYKIHFMSPYFAYYLVAESMLDNSDIRREISIKLDSLPDENLHIIRILANLDDVDLSATQSDISVWVQSLGSAEDKLRILLERSKVAVANDRYIEDIIRQYATTMHVGTSDSRLDYLRKLLTDPADNVFMITLRLARDIEWIREGMRTSSILGAVAEYNPARFDALIDVPANHGFQARKRLSQYVTRLWGQFLHKIRYLSRRETTKEISREQVVQSESQNVYEEPIVLKKFIEKGHEDDEG